MIAYSFIIIVRADSKRLNEQLERLEELLEGTLGVQLVKKSRTGTISLSEHWKNDDFQNRCLLLTQMRKRVTQVLIQEE